MAADGARSRSCPQRARRRAGRARPADLVALEEDARSAKEYRAVEIAVVHATREPDGPVSGNGPLDVDPNTLAVAVHDDVPKQRIRNADARAAQVEVRTHTGRVIQQCGCCREAGAEQCFETR